MLEIVSNDRAFDAVGDAAAARGVVYHRLLHKRGAHAAAGAEADDEDEPKRRRRSRGGRRRARTRHRERADRAGGGAARPRPHPHRATSPHRRRAPRSRKPALARPRIRRCTTKPHGATRDQIVSVIGRLSGSDPARWINLDVLEKALKSEGFARPPGSPRLVTRLRMFKDVEVDSHGRAAAASPTAEPAARSRRRRAETEAAPAAKAAPKKRRRRRKPSGSNGDAGESVNAETASMAAAPYAEPPAE